MLSFPTASFTLLIIFVVATRNQSLAQVITNDDDELGAAASLFSGPVELVAEHEEFRWLESPVWSDDGNFLLFSDVKWFDNADGVTCGMIWKWDETTQTVSKFIPCSGLIGPGDTPANIADYVEGGSNGLYWGWKGAKGKDLIICQHGKRRIVRINLDDVDETTGDIDPSRVTVLVDSHNGVELNSPNDMYMFGDDLYFTDPPFGRQYFSSDDAIADAFDNLAQDVGVYVIRGEPSASDATPVEPERILNFGRPSSDDWKAPNGIAVTEIGEIIVAITDFVDPHFEAISDAVPFRLESEYRLQDENGTTTTELPALNDGVTYSPGLNVLFGSGPGGIYMYDTTNSSSFELLGFLRLDDLCSNSVIGGGYLWMLVNTRLMRIPLSEAAATATAGEGGQDPTTPSTSDAPSTTEGDAPSNAPTPSSANRAFSHTTRAFVTAFTMLLVLSGP